MTTREYKQALIDLQHVLDCTRQGLYIKDTELGLLYDALRLPGQSGVTTPQQAVARIMELRQKAARGN